MATNLQGFVRGADMPWQRRASDDAAAGPRHDAADPAALLAV